MIYELFQFLSDFPGARLMSYISFRAIVAGVMGLCISIWVGGWFIQLLKRKKISETQRDEKTDPFNTAKKGVPTSHADSMLIDGQTEQYLSAINAIDHRHLRCHRICR